MTNARPRPCLWPGCPNYAEPREKLCITCQLAGRVLLRRRGRPPTAIQTSEANESIIAEVT